ncbi:MAG: PucR family transcriptional regulator [Clostridiales bacterium]|nr:PucR family transcriptional regulator [Clostridiales bacterium]
MAITLNSLCKYAKENYDMYLICGESNMNNLVNWVHMLEDPETASFLHGQELIFSTGIGHDNTDWLLDFTKGLVEHQASGLVLNLGPYIRSVPEELSAYCREAQFPLFTIPWKTRIVDITNDFCRKIIKSEESEVSTASAFKDAIFSPEKASEYKPVLERKEFDPDAEFRVFVMTLKQPVSDTRPDFDKMVRAQLTRLLFATSDRVATFRQDRFIVAVLQNFALETVEEVIDRLEERCLQFGRGYGINAGISINDNGLKSLSRNYRRAVSLLNIARKQDKPRISYQDLGVYQLLLETEDTRILGRLYAGILGPIEDYDAKNQTDLLSTLRCYLESNASVQEVAGKTYVHRNTINYKIKKIREITGCELNYEDGLRFMLAFHIKDLQ